MKIDKRKNYYIVLDTEGLGLNDRKNKVYGRQRSYDIGYVITDKKGNLIKMFNALTKEIFGDDELMSTAYFADKIPLYDYMIDNKEIKVKLFHNIVREIKKDLKEYKIKGILAFNAEYDINALVETAQYSMKSNCPTLTYTKTKNGKFKPNFEKFLQKLFDTKVEFYDIWTMACATLGQQKTFLANAKYTEKGNIKTNAEIFYQYISQDESFVEDHTALSDAIIESEILARIFANGGTLRKQMYFPFRLIPKEYQRKRVA